MTIFAEITPDQLDPEPAGFKSIDPSSLDPEPTQYTPGESFVLNASNLFGAGPAIQGFLHSRIEGGDYEKWRQAYQQATEQATAQNPKAALAGKGTALVTETGIGGGVGKAIGAAGKAAGIAERVAPFVKANPLISSVLESGLAGAGYGAASGAGEAASKGEDVTAGALRGAGGGAVIGGALGAVTGGIAKAARGAVERADNALVPGVTDALTGAERGEVVSALRKEPELQRLANKPTAEAVAGLEQRAAKTLEKADELIAHIDSKAGGIPIGKFASVIDSEIAQLGKTPLREQYVKALQLAKESALKSWVPEELSQLLSSEAAKESRTGLMENLLKRRDASAVPLSKLEELARDVPKNLPGTPEVKAYVGDVLRSVRDAHLENVAAKIPEIKGAAEALRDLDKDFKIISTITEAIKERPTGEHGGLASLISLFTHHGPLGAAAALASGHPIPAAILAAPAVAKKGTQILAWLEREAANGNQKAIRILKAADAAKSVGLAGAGAVGNARSGMLADNLTPGGAQP